jgi:hypothetical protein
VLFSPASCHFIPLWFRFSPQHPLLEHHKSVCSLNVRDHVSHPCKIPGHFFLYILILMFCIADGKTKDCELHGSKHSLDLSCTRFLRECSFVTIVSTDFDFFH